MVLLIVINNLLSVGILHHLQVWDSYVLPTCKMATWVIKLHHGHILIELEWVLLECGYMIAGVLAI